MKLMNSRQTQTQYQTTDCDSSEPNHTKLHHWENIKCQNLGTLNAHIFDILYIPQTDSVNQQSKTVFPNYTEFKTVFFILGVLYKEALHKVVLIYI
jgi:hypothetical protein